MPPYKFIKIIAVSKINYITSIAKHKYNYLKNLLTISKMTPELLQKRLSFNLKKVRKILGFSQEKLAEKAQISFQMINDIEGCRRWPSEKTLSKLANALQTDVYTLFLPENTNAQATPFQKQTIATDLQKLFAESVEQYLEKQDVSSLPNSSQEI